jgi:hypothetical protein
MERRKKSVLLLGAFIAVCIIPGIGLCVPTSYIIERSLSYSHYNGTLISSSNEGSIEVELANTMDVLQNVVIELSTLNRTNLINSTAYAAVAASPYSGDRTRLYISTNESNEATTYTFSQNKSISIRMGYRNLIGGNDLGPENNTLEFIIHLNASENLNSITANFIANRDVFEGGDSMNIINATSSSGSIEILDSNSNGHFDKAVWTGNLRTYANITLYASIAPDINYDSGILSADIDSQETLVDYTQSASFSGISFADRFSRGSLRQGVEITPKANWMVRGFMKNIAYGQIYRVHSWALYEVDSNTSSLSGNPNREILPGEVVYTDEYDTGIPAAVLPTDPINKAIYYSAAYDWEVKWGSSYYRGILQGYMDMPTLYQMDFSADKRIDILSNGESGRSLEVTDTMRHIGHANLQADSILFNISYSEIWTLSGLKAYIANGSGRAEINITSVSSMPGRSLIYLSNLSMQQNDIAQITYILSSGKEDEQKTYQFGLTAIGKTKSGTPAQKILTRELTIPGIYSAAPGGGGGGGGIAPLPVLEIIRKDANDFLLTESLHFNNATFRVVDTGGKGLRDPIFFIYLPLNSKLDIYSIKLISVRGEIPENILFGVKDNGIKKLGETEYREYIVQLKSDPLNPLTFYEGDSININYYSELPFGTNTIITRAYGYNYYEDKYFFEDIVTQVRREYWRLQDLEIREGPWEPLKAIVGSPVKWIKAINIINPNERQVRERYSFGVYDDRLSVHVLESVNGETSKIPHEEEAQYVNFIVNIAQNARSTYILELTTPPILEVGRKTEIIEVGEGIITFNTQLTIQNFARRAYFNATLPLEIKDILECSHDFIRTDTGIDIPIPEIASGQNITVNITYRERPPKIIMSLDKLEYSCRENMLLDFILIPYNKDGYIEIEFSGPNPSRDLIYADIIEIDEVPKQSLIKIPLPLCDDGEYTLKAYYKSEFKTLLISEKTVPILCEESSKIPWIAFLLAIGLVLIIANRKIYQKKTLKQEIKKAGK